MKLVFSPQAWEDYQHWVQTDRKLARRSNDLIKDTIRNPHDGIGKPELLTACLGRILVTLHQRGAPHGLPCCWPNLEIAQLRFHYA
jgi:Uncharacterized protein conserved in bacteria